MKKLWVSLILIALMVSFSSAKWKWASDVAFQGQVHGVAVDPDGKLWIGGMLYNDTLVPGDTLTRVKAVIILNPDGSPASFSPLAILTNDSDINDTLWNVASSGCRGISVDKDGNILYSRTASLYRLDYKTGKVMNRFVTAASMTQAGWDTNGYVYVGHVAMANAGHVLDEDFAEYASVPLMGIGNARSLIASDDGKDILVGAIYQGPNGVRVYHSDDGPDGTYSCTDTVGTIFGDLDSNGVRTVVRNMWVQCINWGPYGNSDHAMVYVGTYWDVAVKPAPGVVGDFVQWYVLDPMNKCAIIDSFGTQGAIGGVPLDANAQVIRPAGDMIYSPRGATFSPDGKTMYTADFDGGVVKSWVWEDSGTPAATNWEYQGTLPVRGGSHGVAVDPDGKIWTAHYYSNENLVTPDTTYAMKSIFVFNPDGTQASFSPIRFLTLPDGTVDTLYWAARGMDTDNNGNILFIRYDKIYRINYKTGQCMNVAQPAVDMSLIKPHADKNGYVYVSAVLGGVPIWILDENFEVYAKVVENIDCLSRAVVVSGDGKNVYYASLSAGNGVRHYYSADGPDGTYELKDTISIFNTYPACNQINMDNDGKLWVGTMNDQVHKGLYCLDPNNSFAVIDSMASPLVTDTDTTTMDKITRPRGLGFSPDGTIAYTGDFGNSSFPVKIWKKKGVGIDDKTPLNPISKNFDLKQNYPNPFNPATTIPFTLQKSAQVTLEVFDIMGRKVETLVDKSMLPGEYKITFDANGKATGTYLYILKVDNKIESKKMMFVK